MVGAVGVSSFFFSSPFFVRYTGEGGYLRGPSKGGEGIAIITPKKERTPKKTTTKLKTLAGGLRVFFSVYFFLPFCRPLKKMLSKRSINQALSLPVRNVEFRLSRTPSERLTS